jgi:ribonuclease HI
MPTVSYYAVAAGHRAGIFLSWSECDSAVKGFKGAAYKKFKTHEDAEEFLKAAAKPTPIVPTVSPILCVQKSGAEAVGAVADAVDFYVYTDGSCSNNGRSGAVAGIGVFFGAGDSRNISRALEADQKQTNNTAELTAMIAAFEAVRGDLEAGQRVCIVSDSEYAIRCATSYGAKCSAACWGAKEIPNMELVRTLYELAVQWQHQIKFMHILSHLDGGDIHSVGNAGADRLANQAIGLEECPYGGSSRTRIYLNVPFARKDEAKSLGAMWDVGAKKWYLLDSSAGNTIQKLLDVFG